MSGTYTDPVETILNLSHEERLVALSYLAVLLDVRTQSREDFDKAVAYARQVCGAA